MTNTMTAQETAEAMPIEDRFLRQLGFYDPEKQKNDTVSIIGLGGIGSFVAFGLAKLGIPNLTIVDDDTVELHNVPNQFHALDQIGVSKAEATAVNLINLAGANVNWLDGRVGANSPEGWEPEGVIVSGVDSMKARQDIWDNGRIKLNPMVDLYIDARIAGQLLVVYAMCPTDPTDIKSYEKTLHSDDTAVAAPCTERGVIDVGLMSGAVLTSMVRHALTGGEINPVTVINLAVPPMTSGDWVE